MALAECLLFARPALPLAPIPFVRRVASTSDSSTLCRISLVERRHRYNRQTGKSDEPFRCAEKGASISAPFERPCFESSEHCSTHTTKPHVRRYIVESDLTRVGDRAHCKDTVVINRHE